MVKRLRDNLSSKYFEAGNRMTSRTARRRIVAYVESYDDIFFWRTILSGFENSTRYSFFQSRHSTMSETPQEKSMQICLRLSVETG